MRSNAFKTIPRLAPKRYRHPSIWAMRTCAVRFTSIKTIGFLALALAGGPWGIPLAAQAVPDTLPAVHGVLLTGTPVDLPSALKGKAAVMVVGFSQASRTQASDWGKRLAAGLGDQPRISWYEVAELEAVPRVLRGWVTKKIRESVSPAGQKTFLLLSDHERELKTVAAYKAPDDAYVLVVDSNGRVRMRVQGALTEQAYADVRKTLIALEPQ